METGFDSYLSPFSWRYGSIGMRALFSEHKTRLLWRKCWVALAKAESKAGLVSKEEVAELEKNAGNIDIAKALQIEKEIRHDLMAEVKVYASQCPKAGGKIHLGATSMDVEDNAEAMRQKQALFLIEQQLAAVISSLNQKIIQYSSTPCMAFTHLQPAEPTTIGYRFANWQQDLLEDLEQVKWMRASIKGKGLKGAVGTGASYAKLLEGAKVTPEQLEQEFMKELELTAFDAATQTLPRKQEYTLSVVLATVAQTLHKIAFDIRVLQSPAFGELSEPFGEKQVGSSAMPFKRNPITCERICSLTRLVSNYPKTAWDNAANSLLERTLDDSANRRIWIPEMFLALDESLRLMDKVLSGLQVNLQQVEANLETYGPFAGTEAVLMTAAKRGGNRQELHEAIRESSMKAWLDVKAGKKNPLDELLAKDRRITDKVPAGEIPGLLDAKTHVGRAAAVAKKIAAGAEQAAKDYEKRGKQEIF